MVDALGDTQAEAPYRFTLFGPFAIFTKDGQDATPTGRKAKALIALLTLAPNGRRARRWLQDKLWSVAPDSRGAASLRQELSALRRHFENFGPPIFESSGDDVVLDRRSIWLDLRDGIPDPHRDLLEGLDVGDPEFDDWLSEERAHWYARLDTWDHGGGISFKPSSPGIIPKLLVRPISPMGEFEDLDMFTLSLTDELLASLHSLRGAVDVVSSGRTASADFAVEGNTHAFHGTRVHTRLIDLRKNRQIWSARYQLPNKPTMEQIERLVRAITEAVQRMLSDGHWADYWEGADVSTEAWELFQKGRVCEAAGQRSALIEAIGFYRTAARSDPNFIQAQISLGFCLVDGIRLCLLGAPTEALREARAIADKVTADIPENAYGSALMAFVLCAEGHACDALGIMEEVVERMPRSPELVSYLAAIHGYCGMHDREQVLYQHALTLSDFPPVWIRTNLALSLVLSDENGAADVLRVVLDAQPNHTRALIAETVRLVRMGDMPAARTVANRLRVADPDFRAAGWRAKVFVADQEAHRRITRDLQLAGLP